ncbi:MAG: dihydroneopterin aldolase [SAR86 cluster bacterium]|jgi:7,8-dihydroneopterin aldolase/epimerase/oxygenase|uniref:7,8-dihydroneopterin aldolase n=1 Tax=SAR86 cluster bacterium TaxID=2030880 RepID=A0A973A9I9_9GAMM|nr:dihydroneopterin aldolase [Pseudomonadales bacterium]NQV65833.1 dihydroneopterin aldolase [SAR86 cluster bacterium]|tara:strand:+ start:1561 stop:1938 length:378 start_codon:yes stop_codon:yes gene_type:complete
MDIVYIEGLRVDTVIGVYDWERTIQQTVVIDLQMTTDIALAARDDDLAFTLDYGAIADRVTAFVAASRFQLLESLAEAIASLVLAEFAVDTVKLKIGKPGAVSNATDVGVIIKRSSTAGPDHETA